MRVFFNTTYPASKAALNALTVAMAIELEADGIRVDPVSPGYTKRPSCPMLLPAGADAVAMAA